MNLDSLKMELFSYLRTEAANAQRNNSSNMDNPISFSFSDIENMDFADGKYSCSDTFERTSQQNNFLNTINTYLGNSDVVGLFDSDGNSKLSETEASNFLSMISGLDGTNSNVSADDFNFFNQAVDLVKKTTANNAAQLNQVPETPSVASSTPSGATSGDHSATPNTHSSNYAPPSGNLASEETSAEIEEINRKIEAKNKEIMEQNELKAEAMKDDEKYTTLMGDLNNVISNISTATSNITTFEQELHGIRHEIVATKAERDSLSDAVVFDEYQDEIDSRRAELDARLSELATKESEVNGKLNDEKSKLSGLKQDKSSLEQQIQQYETQNPNQEIQKINSEIQTLNSDISTLEAEKRQKEEEIKKEREQETITDEENLSEALKNGKIGEDKLKNTDAYVFGKAQAYRQSDIVKFMMDYATDPETKKEYDQWYAEKWGGKGAYCAVFTSNVTEVLYAKVADKLGLSKEDLRTVMAGTGDKNNSFQGVTGNQMSMEAASWGRKIQSALDAAGIKMQATVDISKMSDEEKKDAVREGKIYPGMTFEYKRPNGGYHTGFIESINADLSWNTIEGNTTVTYDDGKTEKNTVGAHTKDALSSPIVSATNSTAKVLIWLSQLGYSKEQINSLVYNV